MAEEIGFENGRNSNFQGLVTLTLTLDPAIRHTFVHHSSTSTYVPNFIEIENCLWTDGRMYGGTFFPPLILLGRLLEVDLKSRLSRKWYNIGPWLLSAIIIIIKSSNAISLTLLLVISQQTH